MNRSNKILSSEGNEAEQGAPVDRPRVAGRRLSLVVKSQMRTLGKGAALFVLLAVAFAVDAYASLYFAGHLFPRVFPRPYVEMMSAAVVGSFAAAAVVSWPLVRLYSRRAWLAALFVASPIVALRLSDLMYYAYKNESRIIVMSAFELLIYPALLLLGSWVAARFVSRSVSAT